MDTTLNALFKKIQERKNTLPSGSYTAELFRAGKERIAQKVGEEAVETVIAGVRGEKKEIAYEMADLWYHCLVLLAAHELSYEDVFHELKKRLK